MEQIYVIGDIHTVSAFRLAGVTGVISGRGEAAAKLDEIIGKGDAAVVMITNDLAKDLGERINAINLNLPFPVIIVLPGIDDDRGFGKSVVSYVSEALGVAL